MEYFARMSLAQHDRLGTRVVDPLDRNIIQATPCEHHRDAPSTTERNSTNSETGLPNYRHFAYDSEATVRLANGGTCEVNWNDQIVEVASVSNVLPHLRKMTGGTSDKYFCILDGSGNVKGFTRTYQEHELPRGGL
jgi:hypothetical protein